jgi:hypothetical protein
MLSFVSCWVSKAVVIAVYLVPFVLQGYSQSTDIQVREFPDGFEATVRIGESTFKVTNNEYENKHFRTQIRDLRGRKIAEAFFEDNLVKVLLGGIVLNFRTDNNGLEAGGFRYLSEDDRLRLEAYLRTNESDELRILAAELIKQQGVLKPRSLKGLLIISLVLGEQPSQVSKASITRKSNSSCRIANPTIVFASFSPPGRSMEQLPSPLLNGEFSCNQSNCCGCCGVGCSGCTGCWTNACYLHDKCVDLYGHVACLGLLPAAVASIVNECMMLLE